MKGIHIDKINDISFDADIFIIPNPALLLPKFPFTAIAGRIERDMRLICELNDLVFDPTQDYVIETLFLNPDLCFGSISDIGINVITSDGSNNLKMHTDNIRRFPAKLFKGYKEGDVVSIKVPCWINKRFADIDDPDTIHVVSNVNMKLNQRGYQYSNFGAFEEVLEQVTKNYLK
jgi:hypothetical protein